MCSTVSWREQAIEYLQRHTYAVCDVIERFVDLNWDTEASEEENLERFETYLSEYHHNMETLSL